MRKLSLFLMGLIASAGYSVAQDDCMYFFPNKEGAELVNKTYDANNNLVNTMIYRIENVMDYPTETDMEIRFFMTDKNGAAIDQGTLSARCDGESFYLNMVNRGLTSDIMNALGEDTELTGDFLDYPNAFNMDYPFDGNFKMDAGEFTIKSKNNKNDDIRVREFNRQYVGDEKVSTPAREFNHASKVTFDFEVTKGKQTTRYKGVEWYATNSGIVRSEVYDSNNNLLSYTQLTTIKD